MPDLTLDWVASGLNRVSDGPGQDGAVTVETGGVAVDVTYDSISDNSTTYIVDIPGYVAPGEDFDANSHLKLYAEGNDTGSPSPGRPRLSRSTSGRPTRFTATASPM